MNRIVLPIIFFIILVGGSMPVNAGEPGGEKAVPLRTESSQSFEECKVLAEQGDVDAQYNLGFMYGSGNGTQQDHAEALKWYLKAAEQKHAEAQYALGIIYGSGIGVLPDPVQEAIWYRKAANQGHGNAQFNLGIMFAKGEGVPQSFFAAYIWFHLASYKKIENALDYRERCAAQLTLSEITEAQNLARAWRPQ